MLKANSVTDNFLYQTKENKGFGRARFFSDYTLSDVY